MMNKPVTDSAGWDTLWQKHMSRYATGGPRTGVFISTICRKAKTFLELGAGSARDSFYLHQIGKKVTPSDFSPEAVLQWKDIYPGMEGRQIDSFNIDAPDDEYDVTFHNGLHVLFEDEDIKTMIVEQARVTRQSFVIINHNKQNPKLLKRAATESVENPLFRIRFFDAEKIIQLVDETGVSYKKASVYKFGSPFDRLYHWVHASPKTLFRLKLLGPIMFVLYALTPWKYVERVCVKFDV